MNYFLFSLGCHANGITGINEVNAPVDIELPESLNWGIPLNGNYSSAD